MVGIKNLSIALFLISLKLHAYSTHESDLSLNQSEVPQPLNELNIAHCNGNRIEALEVGRQCSRRCRKDIPCENTRKQCLCDGLCGLSCIKPDLSCPDLPKLEKGDFAPKKSLFNTRVVYHCNEGHFLFGSNERICQGDEDWSGTPAECLSEPACGNPPKTNHARNPNDGIYRLNDRVNYSCYPGYQSKGSPESTCKLVKHNQTAWEWTLEPFRCIRESLISIEPEVSYHYQTNHVPARPISEKLR